EAALAGFKLNLAGQVRAAFYDLLADQKILDVQDQRRKATETFVAAATKRVEGGFAPVTERTKAQVDLIEAKRQVRAAHKAAVVARAVLNLLMGRAADTPVDLQGELGAPRL